jgi:2-polyprenyl-3-methyl-5-hydroxy-6-metoxy-1,4-benzoquinol methylase
MSDTTDPADLIEVNRVNWDERVVPHLKAYGAEAFADDPSALSGVVRDDLDLMRPHLEEGSVAGRRLLHLQCHIGTDTLSWARLGARVTGVDFSGAAIEAADALAARAGLPARFVQATVEEAPEAVGERFDIVYTSIGVLCWLPDLAAWARVIHDMLEPGGLFFVRDAHPMLYTLDEERADELVVRWPYFDSGTALRWDDPSDYADDHTRLENATTFEWHHSLADVVQSLLDAGLELTSFGEHRTIPWRAHPSFVEHDGGWVLPEGAERLPLTFSLTARRPQAS